MKGRYDGHSMSVYGAILPGAARLARLPVELSPEAKLRLRWIRWHECHERNARKTCRHFGISPDTFYRWWGRYREKGPAGLDNRLRRPRRVRQRSWSVELINAVHKLRDRYPRWGKEKLTRLLPSELATSVSTVGRILSYLRRRGVLIEPQIRRRAASRSRSSRPYAIRKPKDYLARQPGDLVQVDTLDLRPLPGVVLKQFTASDVVSRFDVLEVRSRATASLASQFLDTLLQRMPVPVRAVQVDGGSEFYAEFETACARNGIKLFVLPPRSPKLNGHVERANRTHTEEFYQVEDVAWTVAGLTPQLRDWERIYNEVRPHQALGYLTPTQFISNWRAEHPPDEEKGTAESTPTVPSTS